MPTEPRVIPIPCPFGRTGGIIYVYYIDAPQPALVDTGVAASPAAVIEPALNAAGVSLANVRWILATHGHWDHIGGAHAARSMAADGVSLALHGADAELLGSRRAHMRPDGYQALRFRYLDDMQALAQHDALLMENLSGELAADRELRGGERISLGGNVSIEVVHTPGHSPGSVSFVLSGLDWAFSGDSVQVCGSGPAGFPLYVDPIAYGATQKERVVAAARAVVSLDVAQPTAAALQPAAQALGVTGEPATWPASFFTTLHGHLARAAARA
ncbi:MAG: MBL fold metallo-hydrolase [Chloroflexi bacterium]|nr:MBL fold metallo-hydrolase [Chloroflexota bacterium]